MCGDVRADVGSPSDWPSLFSLCNIANSLQMYSGVLILDGNRARFAAPDWKTMLVMKVLRARLREMLTRSFKNPGKLPTAQQEKWLDVWQQVFSQDFGDKAGASSSTRSSAA